MTSANPIHDAIAAAERDLGWFERHLPGRHAAPETPAPGPVNLAAATAAAQTQEEPMSLTTLEADVKADLTDGLDWLEGFTGRLKAAAPNIIATTEAVGSSTVGKLAETIAGRVLPAPLESVLVNVAKTLCDTFDAQQAAQPADPAQQPVPAGQ